MNPVISSTVTFGRNVLGPDRITASTGSPPAASSSVLNSRPRTTRSSFTTMQVSQSDFWTRAATSRTGSSSRHVGTSVRAAPPIRGMLARVPSIAPPLANQSAFPAA